ncbi:MAG: hypothetical protein JW808_12195, partial [Victivallales bacterium]|nr:hypothetical protein [Victivallales bacterium]
MRLTVFVVLFWLLFAAGCGSINPQAGLILADRGSETASQIAEAYNLRATELEQYIEGEFLLAGLEEGNILPDATLVETVDQVKNEMLLRKEIFVALGEAYRGFGALAAYGSDISQSMRGLTSAVNEYSIATRGTPFLSAGQEDLAAIAASQALEKYHHVKLKKASALLRGRVDAVLDLLSEQSERAAVAAMEREIDRKQLKVATAFWRLKLGLPTEIIASHIEIYGLAANRKETISLLERSTAGSMSEAVENVLKFRNARRARQRRDAYDAATASLRFLADAHRNFEKGDDFSLQSLP